MATATTPKEQAGTIIPPPAGEKTPARTPAAPRGRSRWPIALGLALVAVAGGALATRSAALRADSRPTTPLYRVVRAPLPITIKAHGALESGKNREIVNKVEGQTTILFIVPDGTIAKAGDLLCELDSSAIRDKLITQRITIEQARSDLASAIKTREVAEFSLREYEGGTYPQARQNAEIALKTAETNLDQALGRFAWSSRMHEQGFVAKSQMVADQDAKMNSEITLDRTKGQIHVLEDYTRRKRVIELSASVQKARSDELAKQAKLNLEVTRQRKYEGLLEACKMTAPIDGLVVHANDSMMRFSSSPEIIQEGTTVRENQTLLRIPDVSLMRVNAKLDEAVVSRAAPGQAVRIRVDALPGAVLPGKVLSVQNMSDPVNRDFPEARFYTTMISVEGATTALRPGMAAKVEILASEAQGVLAVPMRAVLQARGESFVYVGGADGAMLRRGVRLGGANEEMIEVVEGLGEGEVVSLDPMAVMTEDEKRQAFAAIEAPTADDWR
ncbi:efflux RND transporter periplasmic adaptor subunit [Paludisphaera sp.]|uniref:efflux RND transporter periplasmic adaptor subunit n=1 Tax=Paludisphaera sp. TaxID=2017432 RepID=UPI00301C6BA5